MNPTSLTRVLHWKFYTQTAMKMIIPKFQIRRDQMSKKMLVSTDGF